MSTGLEVLVEPEFTALAVPSGEGQQSLAGVHALGVMESGEFERQLSALKTGMERLDRCIKELLEDGVDIITIPGVKGKVLALPGAEKLDFIARLVCTYEVRRTSGDGLAAPLIHYLARADLHLGSASGAIVASAIGTANSHEPRYRYRSGERECPDCQKSGTVFRSKHEAKGGEWRGAKGWYCWDKRGGCGKEFAPDDKRITDQRLGRIENPDPMELDNTICKIAQKRAHTSATKAATGGSARFTVDVDENPATFVDNVYTDAQDPGRPVEMAPATPKPIDKERRAAVDFMLSLAPSRGMKKMGDVFTELLRLELVKVPVKSLDEVPTEVINKLLAKWQGVPDGPSA